MKIPVVAALLALPCLASAVTLTKVGTVPSNGGHSIVVADGTKLHDGTWVVGDSANAFWGSSDQGKTWSQVPALPGDTIQTMGDALSSVQSYDIWTPSKGWHEMTFPASWNKIFATGGYTYVGSDGVAAIQASDTSAVRYYKTADGFDTWTDFLTVANADLPVGIDPVGWAALGKIWYILPDSGYARGTADGKVWTRIALPSGITTKALTSQRADSILTLIGSGSDNQAVAGYSLDKGNSCNSSMAVQLDASLLGSSWQVVGADGAVRARGTASSLRLDLPTLRGAGWLKVGNTTLAIPSL